MSKHTNLPNIILISELILCIEWASSTVERGFSTTGRLLTPRKSLTKLRLDNLLMLRVNIPVWKSLDPNCEEKLIAKAMATYIPGRYHETKSTTSSATKLMHTNIKTDDLFLTPQRQSAVSSEFLTDESLFTLTDDESGTEED